MKNLLLLVFMVLGVSAFSAPRVLNRTTPDTVRVGTFVISVHDINFHDKEYTVRFWLWFVYKDPSRELEAHPKFDFVNQIDIPNAKDIETSEVISDTVDGKVWVQMKMKCTMKENWEVHDFPFDEQKLKVVVEDNVFDNMDVVFVADSVDSRFDNVEALDGWSVDNFKVSTGEQLYQSGFGDPRKDRRSATYSTFTFEMDIERSAGGLFMKIFIGMYIAFLISLVSFLSDPGELEPRFGLPVGGLFAAVGNKYIIDSLLPESSHFSLVDTLHSLTFFGILSILSVSAIALKLNNADKIPAAHKVNKIGGTIVVVVYVIANFYFILRA